MPVFSKSEWRELRDQAILSAATGPTTGNVWYVHSSGANTNVGNTSAAPLATWETAYNKCTANHGDVIVLMPGHAETLSATTQGIDLDVAGIATIGMGWGRSIPAITCAAIAIDGLEVAGASNYVQNIRIIGAAACTALININAGDFHAHKVSLEHGAAPLAAVTVTGDGERFKFTSCKWLGTANGPDYCIDCEGHVEDWEVSDCVADYGVAGLDLAFMRANVDAVPGGLCRNLQVIGIDTLLFDFNSSVSATGDGLVSNVQFSCRTALTSIEDALDVGGYNFVNVLGTDVAASRGGNIPLTTAS